jgi:outer membrane protein assembly factor BamD (BamD/ComL family)
MRLLFYAILVAVLCQDRISQAAGSDTWSAQDTPSQSHDINKPRIKRGVHWYRYPNKQTDSDQEKFAYALYQAGRLRRAANAYQALVYAWPDSRKAAPAQLALAKIQQKRGQYEDAFDEYQYLIDNYPGQFNYAEVLEFQFQIASYLMHARTGQFLILPGFQSPERALPLFEKIIRNAPSWGKAPLAQFNIARIHEMNDNLEEAVTAYELLQNRYQSSPWAGQASFREAYSLFRLSDQRKNDENALNAARAALVDFIRSYPASPDVGQAETYLRTLNTRLTTMAFERALFYDRQSRRPEAALLAYEDFLKNFPASEQAATAQQRIEQLRKTIR